MKWKFLHILFLLLAIYSYGQVTIVGITDEKEFKQDKKFVLTFIIQINGSDLVQESPIKLPDFSKFDELGSASEQNTLVDQRTGTLINQFVYQYVLQPKQAGKIKIGSALVKVNGKMYKSESFDIFVKEADRKNTEHNSIAKNQSEVFMNLEVKDKSIYQYQPTIAVLRVFSKDYDIFRKVSNIHFPKTNEVDIDTSVVENSEIEPSEHHPNWLSQVVAIYTIIPNETGKVEIPPAIANIKNNGVVEKIASNKVRLQVKSLPKNSPKEYKNAIGQFEFTLNKISKEPFQEIGKPIEVVMKVSGTGNLKKLTMPQLYPSANYTLYKPKVQKNIKAHGNTYQGEISATYVLVPKNAGEITIKTENFSYYDDQQEAYVDLGKKVLPVNVLTAEQFAKTQTTIEKVNNYTNTVLEKVESPILKTSEFKVKEKSKINWKIVLANLALVFGVIYGSLLYSRYRKAKKRRLLHARKLNKPLGSIAETEAELRNQKKIDFDSHFQYLQNLANSNQKENFFIAYADLQSEVERHFLQPQNSVVEEWWDRLSSEVNKQEFVTLHHNLEVEKYNPNSDAASLQQLAQNIIEVYKKFQ